MKLGFLCSWERESKERENGDGVCLVEADSTPFVSLSTNIHVSLYVYTFFSLFLNLFFSFLFLFGFICWTVWSNGVNCQASRLWTAKIRIGLGDYTI